MLVTMPSAPPSTTRYPDEAFWLPAEDAVLRRACPDDITRMARVYVRSQHHDGTAADRHGITQETVSRWMLRALQLDEIWLLERSYGEIVGLLALTGGEIDILDVEPTLRRRGYGTRLMDAAKSLRPGGLSAWIGQGRPSARSFLAGQGFVTLGTRSNGIEKLIWGPSSDRLLRR